MKCQNCGFTFSNGCLCPQCGVDTYIFRKTRNVSIRLYNEGVNSAKDLDLSGAIANLEQSLLFDKNNIPARNLLGLIYCETGRIADALKHWIISTSLSDENNPATGYMNYLSKNGRDMEKYNDAVRMYNQAILYLSQGSDDLAIIQLKKAVDLNPDFIDAYNLLTLCCIEEKNYKRAQQFIDTVLKKDCKNPLALRYVRMIGGTIPMITVKKNDRHTIRKEEPVPKTVSSKKTDSNPPIPRYKRKEKQNSLLEKRDIIAFFAGIVVAAIVLLVLVVPAINESKDKSIDVLQKQVESYAGVTKMTPEEVLAMRTELETLQSENKLLRSEENKQANLELLQTAVAQLSDTDFENCVITLETIDTVGFSEEDLAKYNSVRATAFPKAADSLYTKGKSEFLSNNFVEAKSNLEHALKYTSKENFVDDAYFYLGKIAENDGDNAKAKEYYEKIVAEFPDSNQLTNTQNALKQLPQE